MNYYYHTAQGKAYLDKEGKGKLLSLGAYANEAQALIACKTHYERTCKALVNFGKDVPKAFYL